MVMGTIPVFAEDAADQADDSLSQRVIAHGGGAYKGYDTTNSVDALNQSIRSGYQYIELDMELSADGKIIMLHDWDRTAYHYFGTSFERKIYLSEFLKLKVHGELEVLTFDKLVPILNANPQVRIITDTKGDNLKLLEIIQEQYPAVLDRIIPQIYDYDQWQPVYSLGYQDIIFTLYTMDKIDTEKLAAFVEDKGISAVTMPDYIADKGYCTALSKRGIRVFVHPISEYEAALRYIKMGAWGVYSGTLLPEEFDGPARDYYLAVRENGVLKKLTDVRLEGLQSLSVNGLKAGDRYSFFLNDSENEVALQDLFLLPQGRHQLTLLIRHSRAELVSSSKNDADFGKNTETKLTYLLWKDESGLRILDRKNEYRLGLLKSGKQFDSILSETGLPDELQEAMEQALIAKKGEHIFYYQGKADYFMNDKEILPVQQSSSRKLLLPVSTTAKLLGAASVTMDQRKDISVVLGETRYLIMADSSLLRTGYQITKLKQPVVLYMNKAMAGGEFYQQVAGVTCIEAEDIILLIPGIFSTDRYGELQMIKTAERLF